MKKIWFCAVLAAAVLIAPVSVHAADTFGVYMGLGVSYALEKFDVDQYNGYYVTKYDLAPEFDDTGGINGKLGFRIPVPQKARIASNFCFEVGFNYLPNFEWEGAPCTPGFKKSSLFTEIDITTYTASIRFDPKLGDIEIFRPYIIAGGGLMHATVTTTENRAGISYTGGNTEHDPCLSVGCGFDYYVTEATSINVETTYVRGWHDLDELQYFNLALGVSLHL